MDFYRRLELVGKRRVDLKRFGWKPSMEEAELLYEVFRREEKETNEQHGE